MLNRNVDLKAATPPKKPFTAEVRLRQRQGDAHMPSVDAATLLHLHQQVLGAIGQLREDIVSVNITSGTVVEDFKREIHEAAEIRHELHSLSDAITETKREIAALRPTYEDEDPIHRVADELDAVTMATEEATDTILDASERIDEGIESLKVHARTDVEKASLDEVGEQVIRIFEACNFQDITGQRITKVVTTLKFVEERVRRMTEILGGEAAFRNVTPDLEIVEGDGGLLNGPQLGADKISQTEIDRFFD